MRALRALASVAVVAAALVLAATAAGVVGGRWRVVPVRSASMEPALPAGSAAIAVRTAARSVRAGDVIVFHAPILDAPTVIHRVTDVVEGGDHPVVRTAGDASARPDPWTARLDDPVVWKVRRVVPGAGYVALASRDPGVRVALVAAAGLLACVISLSRVWRPRPPDASPSIA